MSNEGTSSLNRGTSDVNNHINPSAETDLLSKSDAVLDYIASQRCCASRNIVSSAQSDDMFGAMVERTLAQFGGHISRIIRDFHRLDLVICKDNGSGRDYFVDFDAHTIFVDVPELECFTLAAKTYFTKLGYHVRQSHAIVNFSGVSIPDHNVDGPSRHVVVSTALYELSHADTRREDVNWALSAPGFIRPQDHRKEAARRLEVANALRDYIRLEPQDRTLVVYLSNPDKMADYYTVRMNDYGYCFGDRFKPEGRHEVFLDTPACDGYCLGHEYLKYVAEILRDCRSLLRHEPNIVAEHDDKSRFQYLTIEFLDQAN